MSAAFKFFINDSMSIHCSTHQADKSATADLLPQRLSAPSRYQTKKKTAIIGSRFFWWRCGESHSGLTFLGKAFYILIRRLILGITPSSAAFIMPVVANAA